MKEYYSGHQTVTFHVRIDTDALEKLFAPGEVEKRCEPVISKYAMVIEGKAKQDAPVLTGFLKNSIQAEKADNYPNWNIHDGTDYGIFQELGTRFIPGKFFLTGACESTADDYFDALKEAIK